MSPIKRCKVKSLSEDDSMSKYTVDRFEGTFAVLLLRSNEEKQVDVPRAELPSKVKEGDILDVQFDPKNKIIKVSVLTEETESAKDKAEALLQKILNKNKG